MNEDERELLEGLQVLASDGPGQAPLEIEARLVTAFRKRSCCGAREPGCPPLLRGAIAAGIAVLVWVGAATRPGRVGLSQDAVAAIARKLPRIFIHCRTPRVAAGRERDGGSRSNADGVARVDWISGE